MPWVRSRGWVFVAITAALACACGARAPRCGRAAAERPSDSASPWPPLHLVGRFDPPVVRPEARALRFAWSGSAFTARFTGPSIAMRLRAAPLPPHGVQSDGKPYVETSTAYSVRVDDRPPLTLQVSADQERYTLATDLDRSAPHEVTVTREAEAFAGVHELLGLELGGGGAFLPPSPPRLSRLRVEVIGDSISCGYGVLGASATCPFTYATERASAAYGAVLGRELDADVTTVCWSGRGVLRNYDGSTTGTMPELFELALPTPPVKSWAFGATPPPDVVVVNLGTNDVLGGGGRPLDHAAFEDAYVRFMERVREVYPAARIFVTTSPMVSPAKAPPLERVIARRVAAGDARIELITLMTDAPHWGCDSHPDAAMNARIAARIAPIVRSRLSLDRAPPPP
jgi:lysophospholipase L1-like esterase